MNSYTNPFEQIGLYYFPEVDRKYASQEELAHLLNLPGGWKLVQGSCSTEDGVPVIN